MCSDLSFLGLDVERRVRWEWENFLPHFFLDYGGKKVSQALSSTTSVLYCSCQSKWSYDILGKSDSPKYLHVLWWGTEDIEDPPAYWAFPEHLGIHIDRWTTQVGSDWKTWYETSSVREHHHSLTKLEGNRQWISLVPDFRSNLVVLITICVMQNRNSDQFHGIYWEK